MRKTYKGGFYVGMNDAARIDASDAAKAPKEGGLGTTPDNFSMKAVSNSLDAQGTESIDGSPEAIDRQIAKDRKILHSQLDKR